MLTDFTKTRYYQLTLKFIH